MPIPAQPSLGRGFVFFIQHLCKSILCKKTNLNPNALNCQKKEVKLRSTVGDLTSQQSFINTLMEFSKQMIKCMN